MSYLVQESNPVPRVPFEQWRALCHALQIPKNVDEPNSQWFTVVTLFQTKLSSVNDSSKFHHILGEVPRVAQDTIFDI